MSDKDKDTGGDIIILVLWNLQAESIIDVKLGDADTNSYRYEPI